ncbi:beta-ketoacyl synthase [Xenorhabdus nematophila]|uniref:beta-ketoacyl synthase n=1 Tax=Xenorhabdus nematophila TaxID=628 RepID=UPI000542A915|nr:beta-ketoacyl synthase [Xenorhabdus nematophila]CEF33246.1 Beta-ketoacyl synthase [Xenorhabdus nematophila str. Websteri]AYA42230.1 beta-ketoacyl synthase [Xenorhabdus nematophila]MBA0020955.1 beta-ketoacyl synthase [Xenorhabdus nematophila]MCB4426101.1 beta-ketoacyl synthase [Xenorhabdus nematophila]QNJ36599.1 beta-ketoacyl synthase [Xenorhabdus nematophila]
MSKLPVIVALGGINAAGRSSGSHGYKRMVSDSLSHEIMQNTWSDLCHRMGIVKNSEPITASHIEQAKNGTLIRKITRFDTQKVPVNKILTDVDSHSERLLKSTYTSLSVTSAGQLPEGFEIGNLYNANHHPFGLRLTIYGASDLLNSIGISWSDITALVEPDLISVHASSALGQIDRFSLAGLLGNPLNGSRISSKMLPFSTPDMPASFINGYIINNIGGTSASIGACASFLYNLKQGVNDIKQGKAKVSLIGCAEAPIIPEVIEGFRAMGALAEDHQLCQLDKTDIVNHRRATRPFSTSIGLTIAESAQFILLMSDDLALQCGANILGAVPDVFINADANKKSISSPGAGNYITMMKAASLANHLLGGQLQYSYVQAHETGTPLNRVTESHIINEVAKVFGLHSWNVTAIKAHLGHSISASAGDLLTNALGVWQHGWIPGITTIDHIAEDVHATHLNILMQNQFVGERGENMKASIINAKGFGGNNASAVVLSPQHTLQMLGKKHGNASINAYHKRNEAVKNKSDQQDQAICRGDESVIYNVGNAVLQASDITLSRQEIRVSGFRQAIKLPNAEEFSEFL